MQHPFGTTSQPFHPCRDGTRHLFSVQPGIPLTSALESACHLLDAAEALANLEGSEHGDACGYLIEMARATLVACLEGRAA